MKDPTVAVVLGNGESRRGLDLATISKNCYTIGCNAIYRDFNVDYLVCCDRRMIIESLESFSNPLYTRKDHYYEFRKVKKHRSVHSLPDLPYVGGEKKDQPENWNSGPYAILLACNLNFKKIYLLGFDLYSKTQFVNNIYKDSKNYQSNDKRSIDPNFWIYQIKKLFHINLDKEFIVVNEKEWKLPREWRLPNVRSIDIENYIDCCNNVK